MLCLLVVSISDWFLMCLKVCLQKHTLVKPDHPFVVDYRASVGAYYVVNLAAVKEKLASSETYEAVFVLQTEKNIYIYM